MDVLLCVESLVPGAEFFGHPLNEADWKQVDWRDARPKPTWKELEAAWPKVAIPEAPPPVEDRIKTLEATVEDLKTRLAKVEPK